MLALAVYSEPNEAAPGRIFTGFILTPLNVRYFKRALKISRRFEAERCRNFRHSRRRHLNLCCTSVLPPQCIPFTRTLIMALLPSSWSSLVKKPGPLPKQGGMKSQLAGCVKAATVYPWLSEWGPRSIREGSLWKPPSLIQVILLNIEVL